VLIDNPGLDEPIDAEEVKNWGEDDTELEDDQYEHTQAPLPVDNNEGGSLPPEIRAQNNDRLAHAPPCRDEAEFISTVPPGTEPEHVWRYSAKGNVFGLYFLIKAYIGTNATLHIVNSKNIIALWSYPLLLLRLRLREFVR
jgi:hypothetical protein